MNEGTRLIRLHGWPMALGLATLGALLVLLGVLWAVQPVRAATQTVNSTANDGGGSLRDAIANASDGDVIEFDASIAGSDIILTEPITISNDIEIQGGNVITVSGGNTSRVFRIEAGANVTISDLKIVDGFAGLEGGEHKGGALYNSGVLTLTNSILTGNGGGPDDGTQGGAIHNNGTLFIIDSTLTANSSTANNAGEIIAGSAIFNAGTLDITNSTISENKSTVGSAANIEGGAIYNNSSGVVTIRQSTISGNQRDAGGTTDRGGGIFNTGTLTVEDSTVSENTADEGGGIFNEGTLTVRESAVLTNTANGSTQGFGGGISNSAGTTRVQNSTFSNNNANTAGNNIYNNNGATTIVEATTIFNTQGGTSLYNSGSFNFFLRGSIIAGNESAGDNCGSPVISELPTSNDYNIVDDATCNFTGLTDQPNTDPVLGPLSQEAGETTPSFKPQAGSPAINGGDPSNCGSGITTDQHGTPRPQGAACDIGSVELPLDLEISKTVTPDDLDANEAITYTIRYANNSSLVTATNVLISDTLPVRVAVLSYTPEPASIGTDGTIVQWDVPTLGPGSSGIITVTGIAQPGLTGPQTDIITNTVTIRDDSTREEGTEEPNLANNTASVTATIFTAEPPPVIPLLAVDDGTGIGDDEEIFTQENTPITITVLANDQGNEPLSIVSYSASTEGALISETTTITDVPALLYTPPQDFVGIDTFSYTITDRLNPTPLPISATADVTVTVLREGVEPTNADLEINFAANPTLLKPGDTLAYTVSITNSGPAQATNLTTTVELTSGLIYDGDTAPDWTCPEPILSTEPTYEVICTRDSLDNSDTTQITLNTTVAEVSDDIPEGGLTIDLDATAAVRAANSPAGSPDPRSIAVTLEIEEDETTRLYLPFVAR